MSSSQSTSSILSTPDFTHNSQPFISSQLESCLTEDFVTPDDLDYLNAEQSKIDSTLNFLLNVNFKKRKPGRPPKLTTNPPQIPDSVREQFKSITDINDLHPGVLLDYLTKINNLNKKILGNFKLLNEKYCELNRKFEIQNNRVSANLNLSSPLLETVSTENIALPQNIPQDDVSAVDNNKNQTNIETLKEEFQLKIDDLEQKNYSHVIAVSGNSLTLATNDRTDYKSRVIDLIVEKTNNIIKKEDIENVIAVGKEKKIYKCICKTLKVKQSVLSYARQHKPDNIYFSEFLTLYRNKLYFGARQLKKKFPDKISAVYTREGNIYYKTTASTQFSLIRKENDLTKLNEKFSSYTLNDSNDH